MNENTEGNRERLLGAILADIEHSDGLVDLAIKAGLQASDLGPTGGRIWTAVKALQRAKRPYDLQDLTGELAKSEGDLISLSELVDMAGPGTSQGRYLLREVIGTRVMSGTGTAEEKMERLRMLEDVLVVPVEKYFSNVMTMGDLRQSKKPAPAAILQRDGDNPLLGEKQVLTLAGVTGIGKTILSIQIGMTLACGRKLFGIWGPGEPIKVVHVHCEMEHEVYTKQQIMKMDRATEEWGALDLERIDENYTFVVGTEFTDDSQLDLYDPEHQKVLVDLVQRTGAKLLIIDPLYWAVSVNSDENLAKDMTRLTKAVRAVTGEAECGLIQTTHYNRSGEVPGSYIKSAGISAMLELRELEGYEQFAADDVGLYITKARNGMPVDGRTSWYLRFDRDKLWFEADESVKLPTKQELKHAQGMGKVGAGRYKVYKVESVRDVLKVHGRITYGELTDLVMEEVGCSEATAKNLISRAVHQDKALKQGGFYEAGTDITFPS